MAQNEFLQAALERLRKEAGTTSGSKEKAMGPAVRKALEDFCRQEPEFAQAIVQGGSFADCMKAVAKGVGASISDSEAFAKAARFYFPGCRVRVVMEIDLIGDAGDGDTGEGRQVAGATEGVGKGRQVAGAAEKPEKKVAVKLLDLADFL